MDAQESKIYIAIIIAAIVFGVVIFYFFRSVMRQHKRIRELERKNANAQIQSMEKDRERIANDLHDDLAPMLMAIRTMTNSFDLVNNTDKERLHKANGIIDDVARRMRSIAFDLMPGTLQEKGLQTAVQEFINNVSSGTGLVIRFQTPASVPRLDGAGTIHAYRIVQEIIHNTIKHAKATMLTIALDSDRNYLVLASRDNGIGFDHKQELNAGNGLGLKSLMNRVYLLKADFLIDSRKGKGTSITIRIPQYE